MSRLKKLTHALVSGYLHIGVTAVYTLASISLALRYLTTDEFGVWQVAAAIAGYLLLIDFGMTGSVGRILIDHKDDPEGGAYGSAIQIGAVVFLIQGFVIAVTGTVLSFWLPQWMNVLPQFRHALFVLIAGQCLLQGLFFVTRIFWNVAQAHQRFDLYNYAQIGALIISFAALWIALEQGLGIYSILAASAAGSAFSFVYGWIMTTRCHFFPRRGIWGRFERKLFREIFFFGADSFLLAVGQQLLNASQVLIIGHTLGMGAAAVWAVATKPLMLAQQLVQRVMAFSAAALSEMIVRGERERLLRRFRDVVILAVSAAVFIGGGIALCNDSFLQVWLKGRDILPDIRDLWNPWNNFLLAAWLVVDASTRNHVGVTGLIKNIGRMRYVYFVEGLLFVTVAMLAAPHFGMTGIIIVSIVANVLCSGVFGVRRTASYFHLPIREVALGWMTGPMTGFFLLALVCVAGRVLTGSLAPLPRLLVDAAISGGCGLWLVWRFSLNRELRAEISQVWSKVLARIRSRA
jgi:O-antigen/teichoic acid export membrane protein